MICPYCPFCAILTKMTIHLIFLIKTDHSHLWLKNWYYIIIWLVYEEALWHKCLNGWFVWFIHHFLWWRRLTLQFIRCITIIYKRWFLDWCWLCIWYGLENLLWILWRINLIFTKVEEIKQSLDWEEKWNRKGILW